MGSAVPKARKATLVWPDGSKYEGEIKNGRRHGEGKYVWPDNSDYSGTFVDDKREGRGTQHWTDGRVYCGDWENDLMHGVGQCSWPNGATYAGAYHRGQRHGLGSYRWADGASYTGVFAHDAIDSWGAVSEPEEPQPSIGLSVAHKAGVLIAHFDPLATREARAVVAPLERQDVVAFRDNDLPNLTHGSLECFLQARPQLKFEILGVSRVTNSVTEALFSRAVTALAALRGEKESASQEVTKFWCFHGCPTAAALSICDTGLLRSGHPLNRTAPPGTLNAVAPSWVPREGRPVVYVCHHVDAAARWCGGGKPICVGDEVDVVMLRAAFGRCRRTTIQNLALSTKKPPTEDEISGVGFDSFESPDGLEVGLCNEVLCSPRFLLHLKAAAAT